MEPFIKLKDVSALTGISQITLRRWLRAGQGPKYTLTPGGKMLFRASDIESWLTTFERRSVPALSTDCQGSEPTP